MQENSRLEQFMKRWLALLERLGHRHGLSSAEYLMFTTVDNTNGQVPKSQLVEWVKHYELGYEFPAQEYERALELALAAGWLKVVTAQDRLADELRWANEPHQNWSDLPLREGSVWFTEVGWSRFEPMLRDVWAAADRSPWVGTIQNKWTPPDQVSLLGASPDSLIEVMDLIPNGNSPMFPPGTQIVRTQGPYAIGPWWVHRFVQLPAGFRLDLWYLRVDPSTSPGPSGVQHLPEPTADP
jgi:hypothetical protein